MIIIKKLMIYKNISDLYMLQDKYPYKTIFINDNKQFNCLDNMF